MLGRFLLQALINAAVLSLLWLAWTRLARRRRLRERLTREFGYFRHWASEEGVLRKTGLIRELNALGVEPADLEQAVLNGADLSGVRLRGGRLRAANLQGANLQGALLDGADLFGADLSGANLSMTALRGANLRGVNLEGASLAKADLTRADLHRANLVDANLTGVSLVGVRLSHARFALREPGLFTHAIHPSVEDWIRERLDGQGCYVDPDGTAADEARD